jgi:hypothetical protein
VANVTAGAGSSGERHGRARPSRDAVVGEDTMRRRRYGLQKREGYLTWRFVFLASLELDDPLMDPFFIDEARRPGQDPV